MRPVCPVRLGLRYVTSIGLPMLTLTQTQTSQLLDALIRRRCTGCKQVRHRVRVGYPTRASVRSVMTSIKQCFDGQFNNGIFHSIFSDKDCGYMMNSTALVQLPFRD